MMVQSCVMLFRFFFQRKNFKTAIKIKEFQVEKGKYMELIVT